MVSAVEIESVPDYGLSDTIEGSQILHCWCWSFETITKEIPDIAAAGFTALQTSPINECKVGENGQLQLMGNGKWYYHYQPTDYKIGNYQLGTLEEFKTMCETAEKYGVKVIVDAVLNHTTPDLALVSDSIINMEGGAYHNKGAQTAYDRESMTQKNLLGLPDLNTQNKNLQQYQRDYLISCVEAGASGFRFDVAMSIEVPADDPSYASDFWPTVLDNGSEFQYGETMSDEYYDEYAKLMHCYANRYGAWLRDLIPKRDFSDWRLNSYNNLGAPTNRLVTLIESHDTYCNENSWSKLTNEDITLGWAVIASRAETTSLYFARPAGSSTSNQWGDNLIGPAGDGHYYSREITAINRFRNEMKGESEKLSNIDGNISVLMIERGQKGAVIVNASDKDMEVNTVTQILDSTYDEQISGGTFTVENGRLKGKVPARSVAVIYNSEFEYPATIRFSHTEEKIHNGINLIVSVDDCKESYYTVNDSEKIAFEESAFIDLKSFSRGEEMTVTVYAESGIGILTSSRTYTLIDTPVYNVESAVYYNNVKGEYEDVYAYAYRIVDGVIEEEFEWPGIPMNELCENFYGYILPDWDEMYIVFSDGETQKTPENSEGYKVLRGEHKLYFDGNLTDYSSKGEVIEDMYKSFNGKEYIYFDAENCTWFYNDGAVPVIKLDYGEYFVMEKCFRENGDVIWRYKPSAGRYSSVTIARQVISGTYNPYTTEFKGRENLYVSDMDWNKGGEWSTFDGKLMENTTTTPIVTEPNVSEPLTTEPLKTEPTENQPTTYPMELGLLGDSDENGKVNVKDATLIQKHIAELSKMSDIGVKLSDVNADSRINVRDVTVVQKFVAGMETGFPVGKPA